MPPLAKEPELPPHRMGLLGNELFQTIVISDIASNGRHVTQTNGPISRRYFEFRLEKEYAG